MALLRHGVLWLLSRQMVDKNDRKAVRTVFSALISCLTHYIFLNASTKNAPKFPLCPISVDFYPRRWLSLLPQAIFVIVPRQMVDALRQSPSLCLTFVLGVIFYCMTIQRPDFCDPSRRIMLSSCILLRCLDIALLLIFNLLAISREVILAFSDISCRMASRVSGPPFWSTFLVFGPPFCSPFSSSNAKSSSIDFLYCGKQGKLGCFAPDIYDVSKL